MLSNHPPYSANIQAKLHSATSPPNVFLSHARKEAHTLSCLVGRGRGSCIIHPLKQLQQPEPKRRHADLQEHMQALGDFTGCQQYTMMGKKTHTHTHREQKTPENISIETSD